MAILEKFLSWVSELIYYFDRGILNLVVCYQTRENIYYKIQDWGTKKII